MPPPNGIIFMAPAWTVQTAGTRFNPPARITIPNNGLAPGRVIDIFQFDHDLNQFISVGKGTVSEDGSVVTSDPGFGITAAGWGGGGPPPPPRTCASSCDDGDPCTTDKCENGSCVHTPQSNGTACDDKNSCTKNTTCKDAKCGGGDFTMNTTGSDADKDAWRALLEKCKKSDALKKICEDPNIGKIDAKLGRSQADVVTDNFATKEIDLDDLEAVDKLRCSWSGDSCQDIIHFMRERLSAQGGKNFDDSHADGFKDESAYRKEQGWPGAKTGCFFVGSTLKCTYDDDGDGKTDRTETFDLDAKDNYSKLTCDPAK